VLQQHPSILTVTFRHNSHGAQGLGRSSRHHNSLAVEATRLGIELVLGGDPLGLFAPVSHLH